MEKLEILKNEKDSFFEFMREKYPVIYKSNIFLRDIQYAIFLFFKYRGEVIDSYQTEEITKQFTDYLVSTGELKQLSHNTWLVNFEIKSTVMEQTENLAEE